jgi:hypothetical protein
MRRRPQRRFQPAKKDGFRLMHELDFYGVLAPPILAWALIALAIRALSRRLFRRLGVYQRVAFPALFDMGVFIIALGLVAALFTEFPA